MHDEKSENGPLIPDWWRWVALIGGILLVILVGAVTDWPPAVVAVDVEQGRLNVSLPAPGPDTPLRQTFTAHHDGLTELSLVLVHYAPGTETAGQFVISMRDPAGEEILRRTFDPRTLEHNQTLTIRYDPLPDTAGQSLGCIERLFESGADPVLVVVGDKERLLPFVDAVVKRVDLESGKLLVDWELDY